MSEVISSLEEVFSRMQRKMDWSVVVKDASSNGRKLYIYPLELFRMMIHSDRMYCSFSRKTDRIAAVKSLIDLRMSDEIDDHQYHFGLYCLYIAELPETIRDDFTESGIGKRRCEFTNSIPGYELFNNDDFISEIWNNLVERRDLDTRQYERNPSLSRIRLLFAADQFANWTGHHYSADWVEPVSGALDLKCNLWTQEKDPMAQDELPEGWIQGTIEFGVEGSGGFRHFVKGESVHAGSAIQVRFGDGWIKGRYEWSFEPGSKIQIHSGNDVFYINEGHTVRIQG